MSGVRFKKLRFKNFLSFGNLWTEVLLDVRGTSLVMGENLDEGGSSGAGKSTVLAALAYVIYDKVPSDISKDRLINTTNDKRSVLMEVELKFTKGTQDYYVRRYRGAATGVNLYRKLADDEDDSATTFTLEGIRYEDVTADSVKNFNTMLSNMVGFSYLLFSLIILFKGNARPFLSLPVGDQRRLTEELFKITTLSKKSRSLSKLISAIEKQILVEKTVIKQTELRAQEQMKHLQEAKSRVERWDAQHASDLATVMNQLEGLLQIDFDLQERLHDAIKGLESRLVNLEHDVKLAVQARQAQAGQKSPHHTERALTASEITKRESELKKLRSELVHLRDAKCPYCLQDYIDAQAKIAQLEADDTGLQDQLTQLGVKLKQLDVEIETFNREHQEKLAELDGAVKQAEAELKTARAEIDESRQQLLHRTYKQHLEAKSSIDHLSAKLERLEGEANPHLEARDSLEAESKIVPSLAELDRLVHLLEHQEFLWKLLTDKNSFIRKNIIAKTIPFLNKRIAYYTEKLNLPHIVLFQPDMSAQITQYGRELDHGNLSDGEKKKLNISLCLSFRDVLTYLHDKVNVLFTDEIDGGSISGQDVESLISLLKHKAWDEDLSIFVVSHRPEFEGKCDRNLIVRKEGGFSTLITELEA